MLGLSVFYKIGYLWWMFVNFLNSGLRFLRLQSLKMYKEQMKHDQVSSKKKAKLSGAWGRIVCVCVPTLWRLWMARSCISRCGCVYTCAVLPCGGCGRQWCVLLEADVWRWCVNNAPVARWPNKRPASPTSPQAKTQSAAQHHTAPTPKSALSATHTCISTFHFLDTGNSAHSSIFQLIHQQCNGQHITEATCAVVTISWCNLISPCMCLRLCVCKESSQIAGCLLLQRLTKLKALITSQSFT